MEILTKEELKLAEEIEDDLSPLEMKEYIYSKGFHDIEFFSDYFLFHLKQKDGEFIATPEYHKEIWKRLDSNENLNVIIARGHGKTTSILIWIMHALLYGKHKNILYIASTGLGEEGISKIRDEIASNETMKEVFGKLTPEDFSSKKDKKGKKWRQKELELLNGSRVQTVSKGQSIRGKRPSKIILDDPQENHEVESKMQVEKFNRWFFTSLYNTLLPGTSICVLGTIIGNLCLVKHLRDEKLWDTVEYKAIMNGKPLWGDIWSLKALEERKKDIGTAYFNQEFMNIPLSKENTVIKEEWIRYYDHNPGNFDTVVMAFDPAVSNKEKADFTGITIMGKIGNKKYVIYSKGVKATPHNLERIIEDLYIRFKPNRIIQEKNIEWKLFEDLKRKGLPVVPVRANKDKYTRLLEVSANLEFGEVFFRPKEDDELIYQLTNFPDVEHDDIMDSFIYSLRRLVKEDESGGVMFL